MPAKDIRATPAYRERPASIEFPKDGETKSKNSTSFEVEFLKIRMLKKPTGEA
jgi:hypothetical protein